MASFAAFIALLLAALVALSGAHPAVHELEGYPSGAEADDSKEVQQAIPTPEARKVGSGPQVISDSGKSDAVPPSPIENGERPPTADETDGKGHKELVSEHQITRTEPGSDDKISFSPDNPPRDDDAAKIPSDSSADKGDEKSNAGQKAGVNINIRDDDKDSEDDGENDGEDDGVENDPLEGDEGSMKAVRIDSEIAEIEREETRATEEANKTDVEASPAPSPKKNCFLFVFC